MYYTASVINLVTVSSTLTEIAGYMHSYFVYQEKVYGLDNNYSN